MKGRSSKEREFIMRVKTQREEENSRGNTEDEESEKQCLMSRNAKSHQ